MKVSKTWNGYLRADGSKGIRNHLLVVYLVECARHVAECIALPYKSKGVEVIGFSGCYPNDYANKMLCQLCTHSNVGGVLLVSLGCEGFQRNKLIETIRASGRPVDLLVIQQAGGTRATIDAGSRWLESTFSALGCCAQSAHDGFRADSGNDLWRQRCHQWHYRQPCYWALF